jgi:acyl carrier protein
MATGVLTVDDFSKLVAEHFELDPAQVRPDALVTADLGLDSIGVYELLMMVEDLGVDLGDEQLESLRTVQDWYEAYRLGLDPR